MFVSLYALVSLSGQAVLTCANVTGESWHGEPASQRKGMLDTEAEKLLFSSLPKQPGQGPESVEIRLTVKLLK